MSKLPPAGTSSRLSLLSVLILRLLRLFAAKFFPCLCLSVFIRVHPWLKNGDLAVKPFAAGKDFTSFIFIALKSF